MNVEQIVWQILQPPILPALVVMVGLIALKKPWSMVLTGSFRTMVGYAMLLIGAAVMMDLLLPINTFLMMKYGVSGGMPNSEVIGAMVFSEYGAEGFLVMLMGFGINLLIARFTRYKQIYLTGHHLLYSALLITLLLRVGTDLPRFAVVIIGGFALGAYTVLTMLLVQSSMNRVTESKNVGFANSTNFGAFLGSAVGSLCKNKSSKFNDNNKNDKFYIKDMIILSGISIFFHIYIYVCFNWSPKCNGYA